MTTSIVRLDRLAWGLKAWVEALTPASTPVLWAPTELPLELAGSVYARLRRIGGPRTAGDGNESVGPARFPTLAYVDVTAATEGASLIVRMSGIQVEHVVEAGQTIEQARDDLLALLEATDVAATFAEDGSDRITITPTSLGDVYNLRVAGALTLTIASSDVAQAVTDEHAFSIELQIYSTDRNLRSGACSVMSAIKGGAGLDAPQAILETYGLDVTIGDPINLDELAGPVWASREAVSLQVTMVSLAAAAGPPVMQRAILDVDARADGATILASQGVDLE